VAGCIDGEGSINYALNLSGTYHFLFCRQFSPIQTNKTEIPMVIFYYCEIILLSILFILLILGEFSSKY
jgi:hypothetical protein